MKRSLPLNDQAKKTETVAAFGEARLVKDFDGNLSIEGGSATDRTEAQKWADQFMGGLAKKCRE